MKSERVAYALATRNIGARGGVEVLLYRRGSDLSLMPGMLELPTLHEAPESEPMLRLRHAIVGTNYYAEVFGFSSAQEVHGDAQPGNQTAWFDAAVLDRLPLTGFARKVLQRAGLMASAIQPPASIPGSPPPGTAVPELSMQRRKRSTTAENGTAPLFVTGPK